MRNDFTIQPFFIYEVLVMSKTTTKNDGIIIKHQMVSNWLNVRKISMTLIDLKICDTSII